MVPAMAMTGEVDRGTCRWIGARRGMVVRHGRRWLRHGMGKDAVCTGDRRAVGEGAVSGGCAVMLRQPDANAMGKSTCVGLFVAQAHEESLWIGADAKY